MNEESSQVRSVKSLLGFLQSRTIKIKITGLSTFINQVLQDKKYEILFELTNIPYEKILLIDPTGNRYTVSDHTIAKVNDYFKFIYLCYITMKIIEEIISKTKNRTLTDAEKFSILTTSPLNFIYFEPPGRYRDVQEEEYTLITLNFVKRMEILETIIRKWNEYFEKDPTYLYNSVVQLPTFATFYCINARVDDLLPYFAMMNSLSNENRGNSLRNLRGTISSSDREVETAISKYIIQMMKKRCSNPNRNLLLVKNNIRNDLDTIFQQASNKNGTFNQAKYERLTRITNRLFECVYNDYFNGNTFMCSEIRNL